MLELMPDNVCALVNLGYALSNLGHSEGAIAWLKRAIELHPESVEAHDSLGAAYFRSGDRGKASEELGITLRLDPKFQGELRKLLT